MAPQARGDGDLGRAASVRAGTVLPRFLPLQQVGFTMLPPLRQSMPLVLETTIAIAKD